MRNDSLLLPQAGYCSKCLTYLNTFDPYCCGHCRDHFYFREKAQEAHDEAACQVTQFTNAELDLNTVCVR